MIQVERSHTSICDIYSHTYHITADKKGARSSSHLLSVLFFYLSRRWPTISHEQFFIRYIIFAKVLIALLYNCQEVFKFGYFLSKLINQIYSVIRYLQRVLHSECQVIFFSVNYAKSRILEYTRSYDIRKDKYSTAYSIFASARV